MAKIEKIVISVGKKKVEFSLDEAKELSKILADMFGDNRATIFPSYPYYPVQREIITTPRRPYDIWYTSAAGTTSTLSTGQTQGQP